MLINLFITLQIIVFILAGLAYWRGHPILWAIVAIMAALLAVSAYGIEYRNVIVTNTTLATVANNTIATYNYGDFVTQRQEPGLTGLNIGLFGLSLVYFFVAVYDEVQQSKAKGIM